MSQPDLFGESVQIPHNRTDESVNAANSVAGHAAQQMRRIYELLQAHEPHGLTCDEIEVKLGMLHQTASARLNMMEKKKWVRRTGCSRKTRTGRFARVYVVYVKGEE